MDMFTLRSTELRDHTERHRCTVVRALDGALAGRLLVAVDPEIPGHLYGCADDLSEVVLAPRHEGALLVPQITEWPCHVYVCVPASGGTWAEGPFRNADWGLLERVEATPCAPAKR